MDPEGTGGAAESFSLIECQTESGEADLSHLGGASFELPEEQDLTFAWITQLEFLEGGPRYYRAELRNDGSLLTTVGNLVQVIHPGGLIETVFDAPVPEYGSNNILLVPGGLFFELNRTFYDDKGQASGLSFDVTQYDEEASVYRGYLGWTYVRDGSAVLGTRGTSNTKSDFPEGYSLFNFEGQILLDVDADDSSSAKPALGASGLVLFFLDRASESSAVRGFPLYSDSFPWLYESSGKKRPTSILDVSQKAERVVALNATDLMLLEKEKLLWSHPLEFPISDWSLSTDGQRLLITHSKPAHYRMFGSKGLAHTVTLPHESITSADLRDDGLSVVAVQDSDEGAPTYILVHDETGRLKLRCKATPPDKASYRPWVRFSSNGEYMLMIVNGGLGVLRLNP